MSTLADACPHCGCPFKQSGRGGTQTIELTGKPWKACILLGVFLLVVGCPAACFQTVSGEISGWPVAMILFGFVLYIFGKIGKFWYHE